MPYRTPTPPQLPPAFLHVRDQFKDARKKLLKDDAFAQPQQLRQFIAQYILPIMENATTLFAGAFVDTYKLAASGQEEIERIHEILEDEDGRIDLDDINDLQKAFFALGSVVQAKGDPETVTAYAVCADALTEFVGRIMEDARDADQDRGRDDAEDGSDDVDKVADITADDADDDDELT